MGGVLGVRGRVRSAAEVPLSKIFNSQMPPLYSWDRLSTFSVTPADIKQSGK